MHSTDVLASIALAIPEDETDSVAVAKNRPISDFLATGKILIGLRLQNGGDYRSPIGGKQPAARCGCVSQIVQNGLWCSRRQ